MVTTHDFNMTRNELIQGAFEITNILRPGATLSVTQLAQGIKTLNLIIREEDAKGTGQARNLWALHERTLALDANGYVYAVADELANDILELVSVKYRNADGDDVPLDILDARGYESIGDKNETGTPSCVYLKKDKDLACQLLYVWPALSSVGTTSEVTGTDGENYRCITGHTSAAINRPITGTSYRVFWDLGLEAADGGAGTTWVTATAYTNGELVRYVYKRPLADFDNTNDNPDMPQGWTRYLLFRTAHDLSFKYPLSREDRQALKSEYLEAREAIFPSTRSETDQIHNLTEYF